jgi:tetratricopeptide (TPR) repeat protein
MRRAIPWLLLFSTLGSIAEAQAPGEEAVPTAALVAMQKGEVGEAVRILEEQRRSGEATGPSLALLGALYLQASRPELAFQILEPLAESEQADPAVLYNAARAALALGKGEQAEGYLERSVARVPASPAADLLGRIRLEQKRYDEAFQVLGPWAEANPEDQESYLRTIDAALQAGRDDDALELLRRLPPDNGHAVLLQARILLGQGRAREALSALDPVVFGPAAERIEQATPELAGQLQLIRAQVLQTLSRGDEAVTALRRATDLDPSNQEAWEQLGQALVDRDQLDEAQKALSRAQDLEEQRTQADAEQAQRAKEIDERVKALLADTMRLRQEGKMDEALAKLHEAVETAPDHPRPRLLEIIALRRLGRLDEALEKANALVDSRPGDSDALYARGTVEMARQDLDAAASDFNRTLVLSPGHVPALDDLAAVRLQQGRVEETRTLIERALSIAPDDPTAQQLKSQLENEEEAPSEAPTDQGG